MWFIYPFYSTDNNHAHIVIELSVGNIPVCENFWREISLICCSQSYSIRSVDKFAQGMLYYKTSSRDKQWGICNLLKPGKIDTNTLTLSL